MSDPSLLVNAFWLIPLIILLTLVGFYLVVRLWRNEAQQEARPVSNEMRRLENQAHAATEQLKEFSPDDPEPYGARAGQAQEMLAETLENLAQLRSRYIGIQERLPRKAENPFQSYLAAPFLLYGLRRDLAQLKADLSGQAEALFQADSLVQELRQAGWPEAQAARRQQTLQSQIEQRLEELRSRRVRGQTFEALEQNAGKIEALFQKIPPYFLNGEQDQVLGAADKTAVISVHSLLADLRPEQQQLDQHLRLWQAQADTVFEKSRRVQHSMDLLEQELAGIPTDMDGSELLVRKKKLAAEIARLKPDLNSPELERLADLAGQLDVLQAAITALAEETGQSRRELADLHSLANELAAGMKPITEQYIALGKSKVRPILWNRTREAMAQLNGFINALERHDSPLSPQQISGQLQQAQELKKAQLDLADYMGDVGEAHRGLCDLLESPEMAQGALWLQSAQKTFGRLQEFHADNWPRLDGLSALPAELKTLLETLNRIGVDSPADAVPEADLSRKLDEAAAWVPAFQAARARLNLVETRLVELQHTEMQTRSQLEQIDRTLAQSALIAGSTPILEKPAGEEIARLQSQSARLSGELDQRGKGLVDAKARQVAGLAARLEQALSEWLARLNSDADTSIKELTASLTRLDAVAPLVDSQVDSARRLLTIDLGPATSDIGSRPRRGRRQSETSDSETSQSKLEELALELKKASENGQACQANLQALQALEQPVVEAHAAASQARQEAHALFNQAAPWLRGAGAWPPASVSLQAESDELDHLESRWEDLRAQPVKAAALVKQLGDLGQSYHALAQKAGVQIERGGRDQAAIQKLESELNQYLHQWEKQMDLRQDNPRAQQEIGDLVSRSENDLYQIQTQARQGRLDYSQALQALQNLHRKVRLYQAVLDDTHVVDINGRVIASRDSQRTEGEW